MVSFSYYSVSDEILANLKGKYKPVTGLKNGALIK